MASNIPTPASSQSAPVSTGAIPVQAASALSAARTPRSTIGTANRSGMGELANGFEAARRKHAAQLAEARARDQFIEVQLHGLGKLLDADASFLSDHGMTHAIRNR